MATGRVRLPVYNVLMGDTFSSGDDLNNLLCGCAYTSSSTGNVPLSANCMVFAFRNADGLCMQLAVSTQSAFRAYIRIKNSSGWQAWKQITLS